MLNDVDIIKNLIPHMGAIINAVPGEIYTFKDSETLLVLQRRLPESDLKRQLAQYNEIFSRQNGVGIPDITNSMIAYVRLKVLVECDTDTFDAIAIRSLFKECKSQIARTNNIVKLTKSNAVTAEEYQKDKIALALKKNEAFLSCLENELCSVEKKLERLPKDQEAPKELEEEYSKKTSNQHVDKKSIIELVGEYFNSRKNKKEVSERLRNEEKKQALTSCEEIPYYDRSLVFTSNFICKDIPAYSIMRKRNNVYFGLTKNISKNIYNNEDASLIELTKATEELLQFMKEDLLTGEFVLTPFGITEKEGMQMYFDFVSRCFEKNIGVTLTVREYLDFKQYYNRLVLEMLNLEEKYYEDYYKALAIADLYQSYMSCYGLEAGNLKEDIIKDLMHDEGDAYVQDIMLIIDNHVVDNTAKDKLNNLTEKIQHFHENEPCEVIEVEPLQENSAQIADALQSQVDVTQNFMQIVVQILNANHEVIDEALYAGNNISQALVDYSKKDSCIKRLGFRNNGVDVFYKEEVSE